MQPLPKIRIGDILTTAGLLTNEELEWALERQKTSYKRLGEILLEAKLVSEDDIMEAQALQMEIPYAQLGDMQIPNEVVNLVPEAIARTYKLLPISASCDRLAVALGNPMDVEAIDAVQRHCRKRVEPVLASERRIESELDRVYGNQGGADIMASIEEAVGDSDVQTIRDDEESYDVAEERRMSGQAPVVKTVSLVLQEAVMQRASDIHFEPQATAVEVRYRIDGALQHIRNLPKQLQNAIISRIKIMADMDIAEKRKPQDGRIRMKINNKAVDLRISTLPTNYGERVVVRILDKSAQHFTLDKIGFNDAELAGFKKLISQPHGMILVTGPTGSGKTTTLYSALSSIKSVETNILTCEDPIEYELEGIGQSAVNPKAGLTFANQLRAILRQDPDVILVGEIRDLETAEIAFQAAMTGHLVFATLHCNDAPGAIGRLIDMQVEPFLIDSSVNGVLAQRLVRVLCPRCKSEYEPSAEEISILGADVPTDTRFWKSTGCNFCNMRGYVGRTAVYELMHIDSEIRRLIMTRPTSDAIRDAAVSAGMKTMRENAVEKVLSGVTSLEEVRRKVFFGEEAA